jgi:glycosyltransferase involved in cell wall biosynthesis
MAATCQNGFGEGTMTSASPRVSIGLPVHNGKNYLTAALDSLLAQTFVDFEILLADNASVDGTRAICEVYAAKDTRIRYFPSDVNRGAAWNFNRVFHAARGEYFKWAAHDDMCAPRFLERCIEVLDAQPNVVVAYPLTLFIDDRGQVFGRYADELNLRSPCAPTRFRHFLAQPGWCHPVFGLIRRSTLAKTGLLGAYPRSDRNLIGELALHGEIAQISEPLFLRRIHALISTEVNRSETALAAWFDPRLEDRITFPRWRRLAEYLLAITRAPIGGLDKLRCCLLIARFVAFPSRWKGILEDLLTAMKTTTRLLHSKSVLGK